MGQRSPAARPGRERFGGAAAELGGEVLRFEPKLASGHRDGRGVADGAGDPSAVEAVAAAVGLVGDRVEVCRDRGFGDGVFPETVELGVVSIAPGLAGQDLAGEERFAPDGEEPLPVEHLRMERPEAHGVILEDGAGTRGWRPALR